MKTYLFRRYVTFGRGDSSDDIDFEVEVTDEEYEKLEAHADAGDRLWECEDDLPGFYERVCAEAEQLSREELLEDLDPDDAETLDDYDYGVDFYP
ncbi:MAG: hypothetical protein IJ386_00170 [Clostridia bacterium]|nr:hypothetical protein [Clostridia bacterium]